MAHPLINRELYDAIIRFDGEKYYYDYENAKNPYGMHKIREFNGAAQVVLKTYAWIRALGAEGLYQVAKTAVLNNNYLFQKLMELPRPISRASSASSSAATRWRSSSRRQASARRTSSAV